MAHEYAVGPSRLDGSIAPIPAIRGTRSSSKVRP